MYAVFKKILGSNKEQKERNFFQEKSKFSAIPKLLDKSETENSTELWLRKNYPLGQRNQMKFLEISSKELHGLLDLTDFINLEELYCYDNQLSGIKFADSIFSKLRVLHVGNNHFPPQDLSLFSRFTELEVLNIENNNFTGSLKVLKNLVNLKSLDISDTNIESGLIHLSNQLESLFCRAEKEVKCQKISEELKDYELGHDCYDFQAWKEEENWLIIPGSWPKNRASEEKKFLETELLSQEKSLLTLINRIYQQLILIEEKDIATSLEKDIKEFQNKIKKRQKEVIRDDEFENESEFNFNDLALVAEKYLSAGQKIRVLKEEIKKLKQNNSLLAEKNEFGKFLQLELIEQNKEKKCNIMLTNCIECGKEYEENHRKELGYRYDKSFGSYLCDDCRKSEGKEIEKIYIHKNNKNINKNKITNNMTNNTNNKNEKIFILEWSSAELKDGTMRYEKFKVITGSNKENLNFYTTFFTGNTKFKKGEFYQLSTPGNFVQDSSEIIQGIDNGGYEFEKVYPSLLIKELWEEKIEKTGKIDLLEADLEKRKQEVNRINRELSDKKIEFNNLQSKFNNLQTEKTNRDEKISSLERSIQEKDKKIQEIKQKSENLETEKSQLKNQLTNLQDEKEKIENDWLSPDRKNEVFQEKENLSSQLKVERRKLKDLTELFEDLQIQQLNETIQGKLERKKDELKTLRVDAGEKLGESQKSLLETLLEKQEDFDLVLFENVDRSSRTFIRAQEKLQEVKDKLIAKLSSEEIEELCKMQTEIGKLESAQRQWEKMEDQEQYESYTNVPPKS